MAKKRRGRPPGSGRAVQVAQNVGTALGTVMAKVDTWMRQREEIARELRAVADRMVSGESPFPWRKGGKASKRSDAPTARKRTMSPEARARIAEAQRKRWAAQRAAGETAKATKTARKSKRGRRVKAGGGDKVANG